MGCIMFKKINSQAPLSGLLTLAEVKTQCRVTHTMEDAFLTSLITVAAELAQSYTKRLLTPGSVTISAKPQYSDILLPFGDVTAITSLTLDGTASTDYTFNPVSEILTVTSTTPYIEVDITYNCGYTAAPSAVKQAMLMMISTLYNNRQDNVTGMTVAEIPLTSKMLLDTVKHHGI